MMIFQPRLAYGEYGDPENPTPVIVIGVVCSETDPSPYYLAEICTFDGVRSLIYLQSFVEMRKPDFDMKHHGVINGTFEARKRELD